MLCNNSLVYDDMQVGTGAGRAEDVDEGHAGRCERVNSGV